MRTEQMIDITDVDLRELARKVYAMSAPMGMGHIHYRPGNLDEETIDMIFDAETQRPLRMDYVHGRCCKMIVFQNGDRLYVRHYWLDHTEDQYAELLQHLGVDPELMYEAKRNAEA